MRAARAVALLATIAAGIVALTGASALPAANSEAAGPGEAIFSVTVAAQSTGPDGVTTDESTTGSIRMRCAGAVCRVVQEPYHGFLATVGLQAGATISGIAATDAAATACDDGIGARTVTISMDRSGLQADMTQESLGWTDCPDGSQAYSHARTASWSGPLTSADPCIFSDDGCVASESASRLDTGDPAAPSVLSGLAAPGEAGVAPGQLALAALLTVILVLLVAFPTSLLNAAVESGSERVSQWWARRRAQKAPDPTDDPEGGAPVRRPWSASWWWAALGVLAAGVLSSFVDPQFGVNPGSARVALSIVVSFAIDVVLGWVLMIWLMRRFLPEVSHSFVFKPVTLLVVVAAVIFTRVTGFEPGIVFGLVAGVAFATLAGSKKLDARVVLVTIGYTFGVALVAWVAYGLLGGGAASGQSFWGTFAIETLSSVAVGGMAALPIVLFPLRGLSGYALWMWSRRAWAVCYAVGLFAFFIVLMPMPFSWQGVGWDLWAWVGIYLVYAVIATALWAVITRPWRGDRAENTAPEAAVDAEREPASQ